MAVQKKRAEKIKDELRKISLQEENKTCFDCGMRGPLYIVTDFTILVCSTCSAIHRSLQHKVKGISMSEFTDEEVAGVRVGGNGRAAKVWMHNRNRNLPAPSDERGIKDFIRQCFVERRYFNEREYEAMTMDIANASLPPVKVLHSLNDLPDHSGSVQRVAPMPQAASATVASAQVSQANAQPPPPRAESAFFATRQGQEVSSPAVPQPQAKQSPPQPAQSANVDPFDSFFGAQLHAPSGQDGKLPLPSASVPPKQVDMSDLFGSSSTQPSAVQHFSGAAPQQFLPQQVYYYNQTQGYPPGAYYVAQPHYAAPLPQASGGPLIGYVAQPAHGFMPPPQSQIAPQQMYGQPMPMRSPGPTDFFSSTAPLAWQSPAADPAAGQSAPQPPRATVRDEGAFASLDPFGAKPR
jgi:hypothetical protein